MRFFLPVLLVCSVIVAAPVHAQESSGDCKAGSLNLAASSASDSSATPVKQPAVTTPTPATAVPPTTDAERTVQKLLSEDGLHVVHFWAPWCSNSKSELKNGWASLVRSNPNVTFTFVTVWNDDEPGSAVLNRHDLPDRVKVLTQPDLGPSDNESKRRRSFLSHPVTWIPSTWIFHNQGELAFALNYGEMEMQTIQSLLDVTRKDW